MTSYSSLHFIPLKIAINIPLVVKYLENLAIEKICCYFESCQITCMFIFRLWVIIFTQKKSSLTNLFKALIETQEKCEICAKLTLKTPKQLSAVFSASF